MRLEQMLTSRHCTHLGRSLLQKQVLCSGEQGLSLRFLLEFEQDSLLYDIDRENSFDEYENIYALRKALREVQSDRAQKKDLRNAAFAGAVTTWMNRYRAMPVGEVRAFCDVTGHESSDIPRGSI